MPARMMTLLLALSLAVVLAACAPADEPETGAPPVEPEVGAPGEMPGGETRPAPGLYDLGDGTAQAIGTLAWIDLEGGFWAVTDPTTAGSEGTGPTTIAVIANGDELDGELRPLEDSMVVLTGERFEGASIRMAGPEIVVETVDVIDDTPGAAE